MRDFLSGRVEPSFNADPFQLGTFDQIAHYRGGRGGRANEFTIALCQDIMLRKSRASTITGSYSVTLELHFQSVDSHASMIKASIKIADFGLEASVIPDGIGIYFVTSSGDRFPVDETTSLPPVARTEFARYWPFLLRDLRFGLRRRTESQGEVFSKFEGEIDLLSTLADSLSRRSGGVIEATSAIRTRPQRTYTPGIEQEDGEGSHVPYEIAKLFRNRSQKKEAWSTLKDTIDEFGRKSGMFSEISIKSFGRNASDPFQIQFSLGGPKMNLVDLGYGTSQILPILYAIATGERGGYFLIQQPEVHLHPQAQAALGQFIVDSQHKTGINFIVETHSDFIVDRVRTSIANKLIKKDEVSLLFFERDRLENKITEIELDEFGEPIDPPESYREFFIAEEMRILGL
jgi:hypothetical protein